MSKLPNAPLQEVIFEIRWALMPGKESGQLIDEEFELASGRLSSILEQKFPYYRRIIPQNISEQLMHYNVVHQYWTGENKWPVIQLGPGIFTINCTDDEYFWENYQKLIQEGVAWLDKAYKSPLNILFASLRYIDEIKIDDYGGIESGWKNFINTHFNFEYHNHFNTLGKQTQIQVNQTFQLKDGSDLQVQFSNGIKNNKETLVWQTAILKKTSFNREHLFLWTENAHRVTHKLFKEMIKPNLYDSFSRKDTD